jgi:hypothetical protein
MRLNAWSLWLLSLAVVACAKTPAPAPAPIPGTGDYGGVQRADLIGDHSCRATGENDAKFRWTFTETHFTVAQEGGPIPPEVLTAIAGRDGGVTRIEGAWALTDRKLALTDIRVVASDASATASTAPDATLAPFKTPVVRFEFGPTQFALRPAR